jgi:pre-mRNA-processing factor SLU7
MRHLKKARIDICKLLHLKLTSQNLQYHKEKLKSQMKDTIIEKYIIAASDGALPRELLLGQSKGQIRE